jgi:hypothetical protein
MRDKPGQKTLAIAVWSPPGGPGWKHIVLMVSLASRRGDMSVSPASMNFHASRMNVALRAISKRRSRKPITLHKGPLATDG